MLWFVSRIGTNRIDPKQAYRFGGRKCETLGTAVQ
jgi:hypothetical protein